MCLTKTDFNTLASLCLSDQKYLTLAVLATVTSLFLSVLLFGFFNG